MNLERYRHFITSHGNIVFAGKNAKQNEEVVKTAKKGEIILHTSAPGSPFCIIKANKKNKMIQKQDIKEAAIYCAAFSKAWKQGKQSVEVHVFRQEDVHKTKSMKEGTFGVRKISQRLRVKPELAIGLKENKIQCSPPTALDKIHLYIKQGRMGKEKAAAEISKILKVREIEITKEKIMQIIPAGGFSV